MQRRRTRERETELCEGIKYDCRYANTTVCVNKEYRTYCMQANSEDDNHNTAEWCVSI